MIDVQFALFAFAGLSLFLWFMGRVGSGGYCTWQECRWQHVMNTHVAGYDYGLYQCRRCKSLSLGARRE